MFVAVTINTFGSDFFECPFPLFFMTSRAQCGLMRSIQHKSFIMSFNRKCTWSEAIVIVTIITIDWFAFNRKFSLMVIFMAIGAITMFQRCLVLWHCLQSTSLCFPISLKFVLSWSNAFIPTLKWNDSSVWHCLQFCPNLFLWTSMWQSVQLPNFNPLKFWNFLPLRISVLWHSIQSTFLCWPNNGNFVLLWSKPVAFLNESKLWQLEQLEDSFPWW